MPSNRPGVTPLSASVTVSVSPVSTLRTLTLTEPSPARSASVTESATAAPTSVASIATTASVPPATVSEALIVPDEPSARKLSVCATWSVSPAITLIEPSPSVPSAAFPKAVASASVNVSEPGAVGRRTIVSTSPLRGLATLTVTEASPARSGSATVTVASSPTWSTAIETIASVPPAMGSVALRTGDEPFAASWSR